MKWLRRKLGLWLLGLNPQKPQTITIKPVYLDRINIKCPDCGAGGMWATPEGFKVAIQSHLLVACDKGHMWVISGAWAEEKAEGEK